MKYAVIKNGIVINIIEWDGKTPYQYPEEGVELVQSDIAAIGDKYIDGEFVKEKPSQN